MSSLKTLLLHLDGSRAAASRLVLARDLASDLDARLDVAFGVTTRFLPLPVPTGEGIPPVPLVQEVDERHRRHAQAAFTRLVGEHDEVHWLDLAGPSLADAFLQRARLHDLVVLGQPEPGDPAATDVPHHWVETVVLGAGVPALIVPWTGSAQAVPRTVLVAWKSSAESARALASAWPVLARASTVHLALAASGDERESDALKALFGLHGLKHVHVHRGIDDAGAAEALLSLASDCGADWLVMGFYGHSRAREWALGGVSRTVLASAPLPVWMAH